MENSNTRKNNTILILAIGIIIILVICLSLLYLSHSTSFKFNDWWIKGRHISEVIARYGEPDKDFGNKKGYYISEGNTLVMSDNQPQYYWIVCDDNGIVCEMYVEGSPGG